MQELQSQNKMGVMPVNKLLLTMSLPMVVSMLVQALYNIVDSMFVAKYSKDALTAVSMVFPIQNLLIAFGVGLGVGINALLSRSLGQGNSKRVNKSAVNGAYLYGILYLIFLLIGVFFSAPFMRSQTDIESVVNFGTEYMSIVCICSFGLLTQLFIEKLLQGTGKTVLSMIIQGVGAIVNIILDPILIFGKITLPVLGDIVSFKPMGVVGAATATVIGQCIAATIAIIMNQRYNREVKMDFRGERPDGEIIKIILSVGIPSSVMGSIGSIMTYGINRILITFSSVCVSVFGVYFKLQSFIFMPVFGLTNGMIPIVAFNYGAKRPDRMKKTLLLSVIYAVCTMLVGLVLFQAIPDRMLLLFDADSEMLEIGRVALRIISVSFVFAGYCIVLSAVFQALGHGIMSMTVSIIRQIAVILPTAYLFSLSGNVDLVWLAFPIAEIFSVILCTVFFLKIRKTHLAV